MPRLSIVVSSSVFDARAEETLVSVLQNRPEYSEIVVATQQPYHDPYGLKKEVRFISFGDAVTEIALLNAACRASRGEIVHVLRPGCHVVDGWTNHVHSHFFDASVAAVAPAVLKDTTTQRVSGAGVCFANYGKRYVVTGILDCLQEQVALAPLLHAGFYRREVLLALNGFDESVGATMADIDLGLAFAELGLRTVIEPRSRVVTSQQLASPPGSAGEARYAERLYRRHAPESIGTGLLHALMIVAEAIGHFPHSRMATCLAGRFAGMFESDSRATLQSRLDAARGSFRQQAQEEAATILGDFQRPRGVAVPARQIRRAA